MANKKLGIDVEIKYPSADKIKKEIDKKWQTVKDGHELKVKIAPDGNSLISFRKRIQDYLNDTEVMLKVKSDISEPMRDLRKLQKLYTSLKDDMAKGLKVDIDFGSAKSTFENMSSGGKDVSDSLELVKRETQRATDETVELQKGFDKVVTVMKLLKDGSMQTTQTLTKDFGSAGKVVEKLVDGVKQSVASTNDYNGALKEIIATQKEINGLSDKKTGLTDSAEIKAYTDRIEVLKSHMSDLKRYYSEMSGIDPDTKWAVQNAESIGEMNVSLKEAKQHQENVNDGYKRAVTLLNEQFGIQKKMQTAGEGERDVLQKRLTDRYEEYQTVAKQYGLLENMNSVQRESLDSLIKENTYQQQLTQAKRDDLDTAEKQKAKYNELKADMKEIHSLQVRINDLRAKEDKSDSDTSVITGKERDVLTSLEQQLIVRKDQLETAKRQATADGEMSEEAMESLEALKKQQTAKEEMASQTSNLNADIARSSALYDEIYETMKRIEGLNDKLASAGSNEASVIQQAINRERDKQDAIRDTIRQQNLVNESREEEIDRIQKATNEQNDLNTAISRGKRADTYDDYSTVGMLEPQTIINELEQAFQVVYESVARVDEQMVNIQKVTEAPKEELEAFANTIYDTASTVGLSADEYGASVERWVTAGKTLEESINLAQLSSMGAFVGNIDESAMVDYMSVPLNAFKDAGVQGEDILNAMNEVANKNAIEMDDLGMAYQRASGSASSAGTSFGELTGMISGAQEATRLGGEKIGTALKAMDINFAKIGTQLTAGDIDKYNFFAEIGVDIKDSNGELRSSYDIIGDLAGRWGELNSEQKSTATFYAAGKNHSAVIQGLAGNWDAVTKATGEANTQLSLIDKTSGSAYSEFAIQQDSVQFAQAQMKNAWDEFLNTVSGGKEGVKAVMDMITQVLEFGTQVAGNETIMNVLGVLLKATLWATANTMVSKFYTTMVRGSMSAILATKKQITGINNLFNAIKRVNGVSIKNVAGGAGSVLAGTTKKVATKSTRSIAMSAGQVANVASATAGNVGKLSKALSIGGSVAGIFGKALGSIIPILGTVSTVAMVADMALGLFDTSLMEVAKNGFDKFNGKTRESKEALEKLKNTTEDYKKELDGNSIYSGAIKDVDAMINKYNELNSAKEATAQESTNNGTPSTATYTPDEFLQLQADFATQAEVLGVDLKIEWNDFEHIKSMMEMLNQEKALLVKADSIKLTVAMDDRNDSFEKFSPDKILDAEEKKIRERYEKTIASLYQSGNADLAKQQEAKMQSSIDTMRNSGFEYIKTLEEFQTAEKERLEASKLMRDSYATTIDSAKYMDTSGMSQEQLQDWSSELLASSQYSKTLDDNYASIITKLQNKEQLTRSELELVGQLDSAFANANNETSTWEAQYGKGAIDNLAILAQAQKDATFASREDVMVRIADMLKLQGYTEEQASAMIASANGSRAEYIRLMSTLGTTGQLAVGATEEILAIFGEENWGEAVAKVQEKIDALTIDQETKIKYSLIDETGLANMDMIEAVMTLPEQMTTYYNLIEEDGSINVQSLADYISTIPEEKLMSLGLYTNGELDWNKFQAIYELDDEVIKKFGLQKADGTMDLDVLAQMIAGMDEEKLIDIGVADEAGVVDIEKFVDYINEMETEKQITFLADSSQADEVIQGTTDRVIAGMAELLGITVAPKVELETQDFDDDSRLVKEQLSTVDALLAEPEVEIDITDAQIATNGAKEDLALIDNILATPEIDADDFNYLQVIAGVESKNDELENGTTAVPVDADKTQFDGKVSEVEAKKTELDNSSATVKTKGDTTDFDTKNEIVKAKAYEGSVLNVTFKGIFDGAWDTLKSWINNGASIAINATTSGGSGGGSGGGAMSVGINPNIGRSMSQSISQAVGIGTSLSESTDTYNNTNTSTPATVDSDVWRYWSKELFTGLPLEKSMEELTSAISNADDNYEKLIPLYRQQQALIEKQIAHETDMQNAQQEEMNSILSQMRSEGFATEGNRVTNLGIAQGMSGDQATRVNAYIGDYKSLYESINGLDTTISKLNQDRLDLDTDIADAEIAKELEQIEKILKSSDALLKAIENDTGLFEKKLDFVSDSDYELKLTISEEGLNKSIGNVQTLSDEFNKLSNMYVANSDNAGEMLSQLETLKDGILSNADAIIEYRDVMKQLEIDRFTSDFDAFTSNLTDNVDKVTNNIDNIKEGLLSGDSLSSLQSSTMSELDFNRKSEIERQYETRLQLEADLNTILDSYAKQNVDRVTEVANSTLSIESQKYAGLLKLASDYSNGKASTVSVNSPVSSIGVTSSSDDSKYSAWTGRLQEINNEYAKAYSIMISKYDEAMGNAKTASEKEALTNSMIIEQLRLQESIYKSIITANTEAIQSSKEMLKDTTLSTEQRQEILENIKGYEQANTEAQNNIKDSVESRYDLEFEMMDKVTTKAIEYSEELANIISIAEAVGIGSKGMGDIYDAVYDGKINELYQAGEMVARLTEEQSKFLEGTYEWNLLKEKIDEIKGSFSGLTLEILEANKNILNSELDRIQEISELNSLSGKSLEEWNKYQGSWIDGIEKEVELEKLRSKLANVEDKTLQGKLELMDRQEKVSKAELEYANKQLDIIGLQEKLENIKGQRNVQTLGKDTNGNWEWQYVADQTEYDNTKSELDDAKVKLEQYLNEQRGSYASEMSDILDKARNGEYGSESELQKAITDVNEMFDDILADTTGMGGYDTTAILEAYKSYLANNNDIISGVTGGKPSSEYTEMVSSIGSQFEKSFTNVTLQLGKIIGDELRSALNASPTTNPQTIVIENQTLEFPNVKDSAGLEDVFRDLPQIAKQMSLDK